MGCPASSVTLPTTAAEVTPWAASSRNGMNPTRAPRIQNDRTSFVIRILQRDTNGTGWPGRGKCAPPSEGRQAMRVTRESAAGQGGTGPPTRGGPPPRDVHRNPQEDHAHVEPEEQWLRDEIAPQHEQRAQP